MDEAKKAITDLLARQNGRADWPQVVEVVNPRFHGRLSQIMRALETEGLARRVVMRHPEGTGVLFYVTSEPKPADGIEAVS